MFQFPKSSTMWDRGASLIFGYRKWILSIPVFMLFTNRFSLLLMCCSTPQMFAYR